MSIPNADTPDRLIKVMENYLRLVRIGEVTGLVLIGVDDKQVIGMTAGAVSSGVAPQVACLLRQAARGYEDAWEAEVFHAGLPTPKLGAAEEEEPSDEQTDDG